MKEKEIMKQFIDRTVEMAKRDHDEILKMVNDYVEVKKSLGKQPSFFEWLEAYNNAVIAVIQSLLHLRGTFRTMQIQKMAEKEKEGSS